MLARYTSRLYRTPWLRYVSTDPDSKGQGLALPRGLRREGESVEAYYKLPKVPEETAYIVRVLHQCLKPLSSYQLWDELHDIGIYPDFPSMRGNLQYLLDAAYVVKIPGQSASAVENLCSKRRLLDEGRLESVNVYALTHRARLEDIEPPYVCHSLENHSKHKNPNRI